MRCHCLQLQRLPAWPRCPDLQPCTALSRPAQILPGEHGRQSCAERCLDLQAQGRCGWQPALGAGPQSPGAVQAAGQLAAQAGSWLLWPGASPTLPVTASMSPRPVVAALACAPLTCARSCMPLPDSEGHAGIQSQAGWAAGCGREGCALQQRRVAHTALCPPQVGPPQSR